MDTQPVLAVDLLHCFSERSRSEKGFNDVPTHGSARHFVIAVEQTQERGGIEFQPVSYLDVAKGRKVSSVFISVVLMSMLHSFAESFHFCPR